MRKLVYFLSAALAALLPQLMELKDAEVIAVVDWVIASVASVSAGLVTLRALMDSKETDKKAQQ